MLIQISKINARQSKSPERWATEKKENKQQKYQENEYENVDTRNVSYGVNGDSSYAFYHILW